MGCKLATPNFILRCISGVVVHTFCMFLSGLSYYDIQVETPANQNVTIAITKMNVSILIRF